MGISPYILLQKYIILLLGTVCRKFAPYFGKFLATTFERMAKFFCRLVEDMDRSPIENNTRPTLRGTSTCFRGYPGGSKVPTTYPPPTLYLFLFLLISERSELIEVREQRARSSSLRAVRTVKACEGYCMVHFLQVFGSDYVILLVCSKYSQTFDYVLLGNLSPVGRKLPYYVLQVALFLRHKPFFLCALLVCRGCWQGLENGFGQGLVWFAERVSLC